MNYDPTPLCNCTTADVANPADFSAKYVATQRQLWALPPADLSRSKLEYCAPSDRAELQPIPMGHDRVCLCGYRSPRGFWLIVKPPWAGLETHPRWLDSHKLHLAYVVDQPDNCGAR